MNKGDIKILQQIDNAGVFDLDLDEYDNSIIETLWYYQDKGYLEYFEETSTFMLTKKGKEYLDKTR